MRSTVLGVFDSGLGGLTVAKEIRKVFPSVDLIYLGDSARSPYGIRSEETLRQYLHEGCRFLNGFHVNAIILACNTLSSLLPLYTDFPLFGVIESGASLASKLTKTGRIGLLATEATVHSQAYAKALHAINSRIEVFSRHAPLLVPLIEEGWLDGEIPEKIVRHYLEPLLKQKIDTLILGCTHYPLLRAVIEKELVGSGVSIVDNGSALSSELATLFPEFTRTTNPKGNMTFYVTDAPNRFDEIAKRFLGESIQHATKISLHNPT